ncbi:MAG: hypothetical protein ACREMB_21410 [Candidatus Rokuibacteriota bacterium]
MTSRRATLAGGAVALLLLAGPGLAHITPPVLLVSDRDALAGLLTGARRFFVREVRLTPAERAAIERAAGRAPDEDFYRFYLGRDERGALVAAATFVTEYTIHGPVRVAVGFAPDGKVRGATVVELSEETYPWLRPLLDRDFTRAFVGQDSRGRFALGEGAPRGGEDMTRFYGQVVADLVRRAAVLCDVAVVQRGAAV